MTKKIIVVIFLIVVASYLYFTIFVNKEPSILTEHVYHSTYDELKNNLFIECQKDTDCKFVNIESGCGGLLSININNSDDEIEKFNDELKELIKGINYDCSFPLYTLENSRPVCENNLCDIEKK